MHRLGQRGVEQRRPGGEIPHGLQAALPEKVGLQRRIGAGLGALVGLCRKRQPGIRLGLGQQRREMIRAARLTPGGMIPWQPWRAARAESRRTRPPDEFQKTARDCDPRIPHAGGCRSTGFLYRGRAGAGGRPGKSGRLSAPARGYPETVRTALAPAPSWAGRDSARTRPYGPKTSPDCCSSECPRENRSSPEKNLQTW